MPRQANEDGEQDKSAGADQLSRPKQSCTSSADAMQAGATMTGSGHHLAAWARGKMTRTGDGH